MTKPSRLRIAGIALFAALLLPLLASVSPARGQSEKRIAFVVGNAAYAGAPLATAANDAGLIAQTLQAAGFDVAGARDLDGESLRAAFHDFLDKAQASGPDTVAFIYLAGYGLQLDGANYFVPVGTKIETATDVPLEALRISDYTNRLASLPLKASFIVLDAAREAPFAKSGPPLASGLALAEAADNSLLAYNATPGTVTPQESGTYGAYARALTEMIREGGLQASDLFDGVRLRVTEETRGALVPWDASRISSPFVFFERSADAPPPALAEEKIHSMRSEAIGSLGAHDAYAAAIERDTLQGYEEFVAAYPSDPLANRVRALLAARREAVTWRRTYSVDTPDAYWSYIERYPRGPHVADARRRLMALAAALEPPPTYVPIVYDVPPPPPAEIIYVERPVLVFSDPAFGFAPPPPIAFLAPVPAYVVFPPPPPPVGVYVLPAPAFVPIPAWVNPPAYVAPPPQNVIFANIHNTTIINNGIAGSPPVGAAGSPPVGAAGSLSAGVAAGAAAGLAAGAIAAKVALPPSLAHKAAITGNQGVAPNAPVAAPGAPPSPPVGGVTRPGAPATGQPPVVPTAHLPAGHELPTSTPPSIPSQGTKPAPPAPGQPNHLPTANLPSSPQGPNAAPPAIIPGGKPTPPAANLPTAHLPNGHELPGATGQPPAPAALPKAPGTGLKQQANPPSTAPEGPPPGKGLPNKQPSGPVPQQTHLTPPADHTAPPAASGPVHPIAPKPQPPAPPQPQPQHSFQPPVQPNHPPQPQQTYHPPPQQGYRPPAQAVQQPPKGKPTCGLPGLPPCH